MVIKTKSGRDKLWEDLQRMIIGSYHFDKRVKEGDRMASLSCRQLKRALYCAEQLTHGKHRNFPCCDGSAAVQFGGCEGMRGNYIVVRVEKHRVINLITLIVNMFPRTPRAAQKLEDGIALNRGRVVSAQQIGIDLKRSENFHKEQRKKLGGAVEQRKKLILEWFERELGASEMMVLRVIGATHTNRALKELVKEGKLVKEGWFYFLASLEEE